ncbi:hypothetical protein, conserved [Angomonas deanei]|uniref:Uncharacterized protein n=1 Tax=Angomonas deanei TaxID=59799 RepID=A0A7G2CUB5_9TRYP|nr:hypothetical protein, conserved [Angomonas deanei]
MEGTYEAKDTDPSQDTVSKIVKFTDTAKTSVYAQLKDISEDFEYDNDTDERHRRVLQRDPTTGLPLTWVSGKKLEEEPAVVIPAPSSGAGKGTTTHASFASSSIHKKKSPPPSAQVRRPSAATAHTALDQVVKVERSIVLLYCQECRHGNLVDLAYHVSRPEEGCVCARCQHPLDLTVVETTHKEETVTESAPVEVEDNQDSGGMAVDAVGFEEEPGKGSFLEALMEFRKSLKKDTTATSAGTDTSTTAKEVSVGTGTGDGPPGLHYLASKVGVLKGVYFLHLKDNCFQ